MAVSRDAHAALSDLLGTSLREVIDGSGGGNQLLEGPG
jgi:hypothetical protein